nr:hypothetical protein [Mycobacterium uberis]
MVIVTNEFENEARLQCESRRMIGLEPAIVTYPISNLTLEQPYGRAAEITPQARWIWFETVHRTMRKQLVQATVFELAGKS